MVCRNKGLPQKAAEQGTKSIRGQVETAGWSPPLPEGTGHRGHRASAGLSRDVLEPPLEKEGSKEDLRQPQLPALLRPPDIRGLTMTMAVS